MFPTFSLEIIFRPPPFEEFLEINYQFYMTEVRIVSSILVRTSDYKDEGPGFDTRDRPRLFTAFLPLLHIDIPFSCNHQE
jgi:hypothetical protein